MNNFTANYNKILETLKSITEKEQFSNQKRKPKLKDIELIAINVTAEYMSIDSECKLFRELSIDLKNKIEVLFIIEGSENYFLQWSLLEMNYQISLMNLKTILLKTECL